MRTPGGAKIVWQRQVSRIPLDCERCDVRRWQLFRTPWGLLCTYCQSFATLYRGER